MSTDEFVELDYELPWPLTTRTRFVMWQALQEVACAIDFDLAHVREGHDTAEAVASDPDTMILDDFPIVTRGQSFEWWTQTKKAAERMTEAMRTGRDIEARTPAEEASVHMAAGRGWKDVALDSIHKDEDLSTRFEELPEHPDDFEWGEIIVAVTGDGDIEQLWMRRLDGTEDPADPTNQALGIGDYRPGGWHRLFERNAAELDEPSGSLDQ